MGNMDNLFEKFDMTPTLLFLDNYITKYIYIYMYIYLCSHIVEILEVKKVLKNCIFGTIAFMSLLSIFS